MILIVFWLALNDLAEAELLLLRLVANGFNNFYSIMVFKILMLLVQGLLGIGEGFPNDLIGLFVTLIRILLPQITRSETYIS